MEDKYQLPKYSERGHLWPNGLLFVLFCIIRVVRMENTHSIPKFLERQMTIQVNAVRKLFLWLKSSGITIKRFAESSGVSERTLRRIKSLLHKKSSYRPSLATLKQIEKASELTLKELMTIYDDLEAA